jgi:hypothetical protein
MPNQRRLLSAPVHFMVPVKEVDDGGREPNPREKICEAESERRGRAKLDSLPDGVCGPREGRSR